MFELPASIVVT